MRLQQMGSKKLFGIFPVKAKDNLNMVRKEKLAMGSRWVYHSTERITQAHANARGLQSRNNLDFCFGHSEII